MKRQQDHMLSSMDKRKRHHGLGVTFCGPGVKMQWKQRPQRYALQFGGPQNSAVSSLYNSLKISCPRAPLIFKRLTIKVQ